VVGKTVGADIGENKCTWLIVQALIHATPHQRELLNTHYGINNPSDIAVVKQVYDEIGVKAVSFSLSLSLSLILLSPLSLISHPFLLSCPSLSFFSSLIWYTS
jgi:geranylgeranyl pyrophosphate synthase